MKKAKLNNLPENIKREIKDIMKFEDLPQYIKNEILKERIDELEYLNKYNKKE